MPGSPSNRALLIVISAPSGAGKTTLCQQLTAADPRIARAITRTTREPRPGERDGVDYYFLDPESFLRRVQAGEFLEHATVHGNRYGTLNREVWSRLRNGQDVIISIRPEKIRLAENDSLKLNCFQAKIVTTAYIGSDTRVIVELGNGLRMNVWEQNKISTLEPTVYYLQGQERWVVLFPENTLILPVE